MKNVLNGFFKDIKARNEIRHEKYQKNRPLRQIGEKYFRRQYRNCQKRRRNAENGGLFFVFPVFSAFVAVSAGTSVAVAVCVFVPVSDLPLFFGFFRLPVTVTASAHILRAAFFAGIFIFTHLFFLLSLFGDVFKPLIEDGTDMIVRKRVENGLSLSSVFDKVRLFQNL